MKMTPVYHDTCGGIAFYYDRPFGDEIVEAERAVFPDGTKPKNDELIICFNCKKNIGIWTLRAAKPGEPNDDYASTD